MTIVYKRVNLDKYNVDWYVVKYTCNSGRIEITRARAQEMHIKIVCYLYVLKLVQYDYFDYPANNLIKRKES